MGNKNYPLLEIAKLIKNFQKNKESYFQDTETDHERYRNPYFCEHKDLKMEGDLISYKFHQPDEYFEEYEWVLIKKDYKEITNRKIKDFVTIFEDEIYKSYKEEDPDQVTFYLLKSKSLLKELLASEICKRSIEIEGTIKNLIIWIEKQIEGDIEIENEVRTKKRLKRYNALIQEVHELQFDKYKFVFNKLSLEDLKSIIYFDEKDKKPKKICINVTHKDLSEILGLFSGITFVSKRHYLKNEIFLSRESVNPDMKSFNPISKSQIDSISGNDTNGTISIRVTSLKNKYLSK